MDPEDEIHNSDKDFPAHTAELPAAAEEVSGKAISSSTDSKAPTTTNSSLTDSKAPATIKSLAGSNAPATRTSSLTDSKAPATIKSLAGSNALATRTSSLTDSKALATINSLTGSNAPATINSSSAANPDVGEEDSETVESPPQEPNAWTTDPAKDSNGLYPKEYYFPPYVFTDQTAISAMSSSKGFQPGLRGADRCSHCMRCGQSLQDDHPEFKDCQGACFVCGVLDAHRNLFCPRLYMSRSWWTHRLGFNRFPRGCRIRPTTNERKLLFAQSNMQFFNGGDDWIPDVKNLTSTGYMQMLPPAIIHLLPEAKGKGSAKQPQPQPQPRSRKRARSPAGDSRALHGRDRATSSAHTAPDPYRNTRPRVSSGDQARIRQLENKVDGLENRVDDLEAQLDDYKERCRLLRSELDQSNASVAGMQRSASRVFESMRSSFESMQSSLENSQELLDDMENVVAPTDRDDRRSGRRMTPVRRSRYGGR